MRFRGDVEGLRAVAVLLVVLDHLEVPGFAGGFGGVDVFFVISGYLITSLLANECARNAAEHGGRGTISIPAFYLRRARRILPAALTVIVAVVVAGGVLLNELRIAQIRHDAVWAAFFGSNVNFIRQSTDYFTQGLVATSPFQHYWSLAVEEQFYLVWPALFLLVVRLPALRARGVVLGWRARVGATICLVGAASLAWSVVATGREPAAAYFSTFTRAWELALGALIGIVTTSSTRLPRRAAAAASAVGVLLLVATAVVVDDATPYPGVAALLPTVAAALLIVGGLSERLPMPNRVLCLSPLRFVGRISYSVYLWHWPLVVFAAALYPTRSATVPARVLILVITLAVATLSYYGVEQPGRRIGVRSPRRRGAHGAWRGRNVVTATAGACLVTAAFLGALSAIDPERSSGAAVSALGANAATAPAGEVPSGGGPYADTLAAWQRVIRAGVAVRRLPASLRPLTPHLEKAFPPPCRRGPPGASRDECVVGSPSAAHVAVLDGDSHAEMLRNTVWRAFDPKAWRIHIFARNGCGWAGAANGTVSAADCARRQAEAVRRITALHPDVLILSEHLGVTPFRSRGDIASSLATFTHAAATTIVLGHTPLPRPWSGCLAGGDISGCFVFLDAAYRADVATERALTRAAGAVFVDTSTWMCARAGAATVCPPVVNGVPVFKDETHIGAEYQLELIPLMRSLLASVGVTSGARSTQVAEGGSYAEVLADWQRLLRAGLGVTSLPAALRPLQPHLQRYVEPYCNPRIQPRAQGECAVGARAARRVAVLTGDSHAGMFELALWRALGQSWQLHIFQRAHCGWAGSVPSWSPFTASACRAGQAAALDRLRVLRPEVLVLAEADVVVPYRSAAEMRDALATFTALARHVVVLGHTPSVPSFAGCLRGAGDVAGCIGRIDDRYRVDAALERRIVREAGAIFVDTSDWFCVATARQTLCPPVVDGVPVWRDGTHITAGVEAKLTPLLRAAVDPARMEALNG